LQNIAIEYLGHKAVRVKQEEEIFPFVQGKYVFFSLPTLLIKSLLQSRNSCLLVVIAPIAFGMRLDLPKYIRKVFTRNNIRKVKKTVLVHYTRLLEVITNRKQNIPFLPAERLGKRSGHARDGDSEELNGSGKKKKKVEPLDSIVTYLEPFKIST